MFSEFRQEFIANSSPLAIVGASVPFPADSAGGSFSVSAGSSVGKK
jgi:hypothetical protein